MYLPQITTLIYQNCSFLNLVILDKYWDCRVYSLCNQLLLHFQWIFLKAKILVGDILKMCIWVLMELEIIVTELKLFKLSPFCCCFAL